MALPRRSRLLSRLVRLGAIAVLSWMGSPFALAQPGDDPLPAPDRPVDHPSRRSVGVTPRPARVPSRDEERAAALARGRQRFFNQVDEFGTDRGPLVPGPGVFPLGSNGLPTVSTVPKARRR